MNRDDLAVEFSKISSAKPRFFRSPGRINLIGDHTDYNEGFVMPAAINRYASLAISAANSNAINIRSLDFEEELNTNLANLDRMNNGGWRNYFIGVLAIFKQGGAELSGIDCVFTSDVPVGAGLSSSAALTCSFAFALNELFEAKFSRHDLVDIAQQTEHEFARVMCGNMDQTASLFGEQDSVMKFDCRSRDIQQYPLKLQQYALVLVDTKVKHTLAETAYNLRREECEKGVSLISEEYRQVKSLRDVEMEMLNKVKMPSEIRDRCTFVMEENERVLEAGAFLEDRDIESLGSLIWESHKGLSEKYQVSCPELDLIVAQAGKLNYVLGARMMGGGFGGCCIALLDRKEISSFQRSITAAFQFAFASSPEFYQFELVDGASEVF